MQFTAKFTSFSALLFCLMGFVSSVAAADVVNPTGAVRNLNVNDFMPHNNPAKEFNETWSYQFIFDNGTRAFVNYSTLYIPGSGKKVACDLSFWNFKGKTYTVGRQYPPERLKPDPAKALIDIKGEYMMEKMPGNGHHVLFTADKNGKFFLDLTFENVEPGKAIGNGVWTIGKEKFAQYVHIPYGRVSGRIGYNDDTLSVKGYAYMDQTWQTVAATDIASRTINFSANARANLCAGRISVTKEGKYIGYALIKNESGIQVVTPKSVQDGDASYSGKKFPKDAISIVWNEIQDSLKFSVKKPLQKASLLDKVDGWVAKQAFKLATGGEVLFYRGRVDYVQGKKLDWAITGVKD